MVSYFVNHLTFLKAHVAALLPRLKAQLWFELFNYVKKYRFVLAHSFQNLIIGIPSSKHTPDGPKVAHMSCMSRFSTLCQKTLFNVAFGLNRATTLYNKDFSFKLFCFWVWRHEVTAVWVQELSLFEISYSDIHFDISLYLYLFVVRYHRKKSKINNMSTNIWTSD